jgi:hypothetical protein
MATRCPSEDVQATPAKRAADLVCGESVPRAAFARSGQVEIPPDRQRSYRLPRQDTCRVSTDPRIVAVGTHPSRYAPGRTAANASGMGNACDGARSKGALSTMSLERNGAPSRGARIVGIAGRYVPRGGRYEQRVGQACGPPVGVMP